MEFDAKGHHKFMGNCCKDNKKNDRVNASKHNVKKAHHYQLKVRRKKIEDDPY